MKKTKVICIGEALIDRIKNKSNQEFTDFLGGAPANVACALTKLKIDSVFVGRVGSDEFGKKFIEKFNELGVDINFLQLDENCLLESLRSIEIITEIDIFLGLTSSRQILLMSLDKNLISDDMEKLKKLLQKQST